MIGVLLLGATAWYFFGRKNDTVQDTRTAEASADTIKNGKPADDTTAAVKVVNNATEKNDGYTFKVVILQTADSNAAVSRMNVLTARKHQVIMYKTDSITYRLAEPFTLPLGDTSRIKDSLNSYYYSGKAFIELR